MIYLMLKAIELDWTTADTKGHRQMRSKKPKRSHRHW